MNEKAFFGLWTPTRLWVILIVLTVGLLVNTAAHAAQIVVTNPNDSGPGSLRQAIIDALPGDEIVFAQGVSTITLTSGELVIDKDLTITGLGAVTISGNNSSRVFRIDSGIVTLSGLTITDGFLSTLSGDDGSGIKNEGTLTIDNSTISDNWVSLLGGSGGGIANFGTLTVNNSTFSGNRAQYGSGGGIANSGTATIDNSTFSGNNGEFGGGGITNVGTLTVDNSKFSGNWVGSIIASSSGGGINNVGTMTIDNSTFSGNSAERAGGGIANSGTATIDNSTFSHNDIGESCMELGGGGGIVNEFGGTLTVDNSTFSGNYVILPGCSGGGIYNDNESTLTIKNSIVTNSPIGGNCDFLGTETVLGANFSTDDTCDGFTQVTSEDLKLGPLKNNGGPTETHALLSSSVAIDAATDCTFADGTPVLTDQRGVARPQGVDCDAGAFEFTMPEIVNDMVDFVVGGTKFLSTTSPQGRFTEIVVPGGVLVNTLTNMNLTESEAEAVAEQVRETAQIWADDGFDVDLLFKGGIFIITALLTNVDDAGAEVIGPIKAVVDTLKFVGFPEPPLIPGLFPLLLSTTEGNGRPGSKQLITDNNLPFGETIRVTFVIGLQQRTPFEFFVDVEGIRP